MNTYEPKPTVRKLDAEELARLKERAERASSNQANRRAVAKAAAAYSVAQPGYRSLDGTYYPPRADFYVVGRAGGERRVEIRPYARQKKTGPIRTYMKGDAVVRGTIARYLERASS